MTTLTEEQKHIYQNYNQKDLDDAFVHASISGDLAIVQYLLTSPELSIHADIHADYETALRMACYYGYFDIVQYLLTFSDLKERANIAACDYMPYQYACAHGHLNIVEYLLTSPELTEHAKIHDNGCRGYQYACENGHLNIVKYLLSFSGDRYIPFQGSKHNLKWAKETGDCELVYVMLYSLHQNNMTKFKRNIKNIQEYFLQYSLEYYIKTCSTFDIALKDKTSIKLHPTELFL